MKCSLGISNFLKEISSLSHSIVFLYFFALITEEGFLVSPCYSWNSTFKWVYLSFYPLHLASFLFLSICKAPSEYHFSMWQNVVHWRREWQTISVFLPWKSREQYEKAKRYDTERWTPQISRCPICYWRRALLYSFLNPEPLSCSKKGSNGCRLKLNILKSSL